MLAQAHPAITAERWNATANVALAALTAVCWLVGGCRAITLRPARALASILGTARAIRGQPHRGGEGIPMAAREPMVAAVDPGLNPSQVTERYSGHAGYPHRPAAG